MKARIVGVLIAAVLFCFLLANPVDKDAVPNVNAAVNPEPAGWFAGDMHVHRSCGGSPVTVQSIYNGMAANDLSVVSLLADMGNGEVQNASQDLPKVNGQDDPVSTPGRIVHWDAEWHWDATYSQYTHQALGGHILALGLSEAHQIWQESTAPIFAWAKGQNGIAGFAHMQYLPGDFPSSLNCCLPMEYPVETGLNSADFISEDVDGNDTAIDAYYKLLNSGFQPGLAAGTDYPCNGGEPLGTLLTYVNIPSGQLTYRSWVDGIANGNTVISRNAHNEFLDFKVNGSSSPGDQVNLSGAGSVQVSVTWTAKTSLSGTIELVRNGDVIASQQASVAPGLPSTLTTTVNFSKSGWLAARRMGGGSHELHTAAVFITVDSAPVRASAQDATYFVNWIDNLLVNISIGGIWEDYFTTSRAAVQQRYQQARDLYQQIALEAGGSPEPSSTPGPSATPTVTPSIGPSSTPVAGEQTIFTSQIPAGFDNDSSYELGTRFMVRTAGQITQARIYASSSEGGTHTVRLWKADGALIAGPYAWSISSGTAGWKNYTFPSPVPILANTDYIISVTNSSDHQYASTQGGFNSPINRGDLVTYTSSGVYATTLGSMPGQVWNNSNYFRDVVFIAGASPSPTPSQSPTAAPPSPSPTDTWTPTPVPPSPSPTDTWTPTATVPSPTPTLSLTPLPTAIPSVTWTSTPTKSPTARPSFTPTRTVRPSNTPIIRRSSTPTRTSRPSNTPTVKPSATLTPTAVSGAQSVFTNQTPVDFENDGISWELGLRFKATVDGQLLQVRIYTSAAENGLHTVRVWRASDSTLIAGPFSWTISSGTAGWQVFILPVPVDITANTDYILSVSTDNYYASTQHGFDSPINTGNLATYAGSGVYSASKGSMPTLSWSNSNYFRDIIFVAK